MSASGAAPAVAASTHSSKRSRKGVAADATYGNHHAQQLASSTASVGAFDAVAAAPALASTPRCLHPLHRCRFLTFVPHAIISLAFSPSGRFLALGRSNGNIELWSVGVNAAQAGSSAGAAAGANGWVLLKTVPGSGEPTVQVMLWAKAQGRQQERLFSAGLNGRLIEWDLQLLAPRYASDTYGGACWSGAIRAGSVDGAPTLTIALGCEDGTIRLFDVSDPSVSPLYTKALSRHSARILAVAFSPDGHALASGGSDGMIKIWDLVNDGRNIQRITVENQGLRRTSAAEGADDAKKGRGKKHKTGRDDRERYSTFVWTLLFLSPSTLLSGDSLGNIALWELEFGTLRQNFPKVLRGDVLCMVTNATRDTVYASGVEGKIVELKRVGMEQQEGEEPQSAADDDAATSKWVLTANHRQHTHDVYALAISPNTLPISTNKRIQQQLTAAASSSSKSSTAAVAPTSLPNNYLLVSGGVDTQLLLSPTTCFPEYNSLTRILPFPQGGGHAGGGVCGVADQVMGLAPPTAMEDEEDEEEQEPLPVKLPARFLVAHDQHLQLYALGSCAPDQTAVDNLRKKSEHDALNLEKSYTHLLDINVNSRKAVDTSNPSASLWVPGGGLNLLCASMSRNGRFIVCSDPIQVKLYEVSQRKGSLNQNLLSVRKVPIQHLSIQAANVAAFSEDSTRLFLGTLGGPVQIVDLLSVSKGPSGGEEAESMVQTLDAHVPVAVYEGDLSSDEEEEQEDEDAMTDGGKKKRAQPKRQSTAQKLGVLRCLSVSSDQQYLSVSDDLAHVWVYNLDSGSLCATLPTLSTPVLALEFLPSSPSVLAVLCARNQLHLYDVEAQKFTEYSKQNLGALAVPTGAAAAGPIPVAGGNLLSPASHLLSREQFTHLSFDRSPNGSGTSLLLHSLNLIMHVDLSKPRPACGPVQLLTGAQAQSAQAHSVQNRRERKRRADGLAAGGEDGADGALGSFAAAAASSLPVDPRQVNFRVLTRFRPLLFASFLDETDGQAAAGPAVTEGKKKRKKDDGEAAGDEATGERPVVVGSSLLVIEAPWVNILQQLPQPLARHRYGT